MTKSKNENRPSVEMTTDESRMEAGIIAGILGNTNEAVLSLFKMSNNIGSTKYLRDLAKYRLETALELLKELDSKARTK